MSFPVKDPSIITGPAKGRTDSVKRRSASLKNQWVTNAVVKYLIDPPGKYCSI